MALKYQAFPHQIPFHMRQCVGWHPTSHSNPLRRQSIRHPYKSDKLCGLRKSEAPPWTSQTKPCWFYRFRRSKVKKIQPNCPFQMRRSTTLNAFLTLLYFPSFILLCICVVHPQRQYTLHILLHLSFSFLLHLYHIEEECWNLVMILVVMILHVMYT